MATISTDRYIYPPRPNTSIPREEAGYFQELGWVAQLKYNGSRTVIKHLPTGKIELWNRHAERFRTYHAPDWLLDQIKQALEAFELAPDQYHILDGELIDQKHTAVKDTVAIWDIIVRNGEHLLDTTYESRYGSLYSRVSTQETWAFRGNDFGIKLADNVFFARNFGSGEWDRAWETVGRTNESFGDRPLLEGVVLKDLSGRLERGFREKNNGAWQIRSRVKTGRHNF